MHNVNCYVLWCMHWISSTWMPWLTNHSSLSLIQLAGTAKSRFSAKDYSDHMALVRAYEGWKDAEREGSAYEYCWRNFLSAQTLQAIHSLRKQFSFILKDAGLLDADANTNNRLSHNQSLVRAIICSGLFPGIASVVVRYLYFQHIFFFICVKNSLHSWNVLLASVFAAKGNVNVFQNNGWRPSFTICSKCRIAMPHYNL